MRQIKTTSLPPSSRIVTDTFAALKYPNYRLWFFGQLISLIGTWMQNTAQMYLIYAITNSAAFPGYVSFASGVPTWMFSLYGGVIADRIPRRNLMVITQSVMMLLAFMLSWLVFSGNVQPWQIIVLAVILGVANAFDTPARQSFVVELVEREDLTNAIALNATMFNGAAVIGPAVAGLIYAWIGPTLCFFINGLSFLAVIAVLLMMRLAPFQRPNMPASTSAQLLEGLSFVKSHGSILALILTAGVVATFGMGPVSLLPAWAVQVLGGDEQTNGWLYSARGLGALMGALSIAAIGRRKIRGKMLTGGILVMPVVFSIFALLRWVPLSLFVLVLVGFCFMMVMNSANALVQTNVPDHLRSRVMSIYSLTFMGGMPIGSLIAGVLAVRLSEPAAILIFSGIILTYAIILYLKKPDIRTIG